MKKSYALLHMFTMFVLSIFFIPFAGAQQIVLTNPEPTVTNTVTMKTNYGNIVIGLYGNDAPKTVANFIGLAEKDEYNGVLFHRVVPGFVIQAGDPKTKDESLKSQWGTGGESIYGGEFEDELIQITPSWKIGYARGVLAMANRGQHTNTSQFFICLGDLGLPKSYTMFGKVMVGMDIVDKIAAVPLNGSTPKDPVIIQSISTKPVKK